MMLATSEATENAGAALADAIGKAAPARACIWLQGELGAGKTTFCRGLLRSLGHAGRVPSPTYTLVEPYECGMYRVYHLDLYRLHDAGELEFLGLTDLWDDGAIFLVEWPGRAPDALPAADMEIALGLSGPRGTRREMTISCLTATGTEILQRLGKAYAE